jgi:tetratricopeptide (TPR) repeat protein
MKRITLTPSLIAWAFYLATVSLHAQDAKTLVNQGILDEMQNSNYDKAISEFSAALQLDPKNADAYSYRGFAYASKGNYTQAVADYNEAIQLNPQAESYSGRAEVYDKTGDYADAIPDYKKAIELNPGGGAGLYVNLAEDYAHQGDYADATSTYEKALQIDSQSGGIYDSYAWLLATCPVPQYRNGKKAVDYALKAQQLDNAEFAGLGISPPPDPLNTLAAAEAETGDFDDAVKFETQYLAATSGVTPAETTAAQSHLVLYQNHQPYHGK